MATPLAAIFIYPFLDLVDFFFPDSVSKDVLLTFVLLITESRIFRILLHTQGMFSKHLINGEQVSKHDAKSHNMSLTFSQLSYTFFATESQD